MRNTSQLSFVFRWPTPFQRDEFSGPHNLCYTSIQMDVLNDKLRELQQLPQFPAIATKVLRVLSHDDANVREISDFIRADAALASGLLRVANSALYAFPSPITSIQKALMMLGFDETKRFILTFSTQNFFQTALRLDLLRGMWRHSLACAWIAEELSTACSLSQGRGDPGVAARHWPIGSVRAASAGVCRPARRPLRWEDSSGARAGSLGNRPLRGRRLARPALGTSRGGR